MTILVAFASKHGSTREVAEAIAGALAERGHAVELLAAHEVKTVEAKKDEKKPGVKEVKSGKLASSWSEDAAKKRAIKTRGADARVSDAMTAELPTISHRVTLEQAFKLLQQKSAPAVGITDAAGKLAGLVTGETIAEMMMLQEALPGGIRPGPWGRPAGA